MRILFFGAPQSIHTIRWITQLKNTGWDLLFLPSRFEYFWNDISIPGVTLVNPFPDKWRFIKTINNIFQKLKIIYIIFKIYPNLTHFFHSLYIAFIIFLFKPDIVHSLGLNINWMNNCQNILRARKYFSFCRRTKWIYSSWGTDLEYYAHMSDKKFNEVIDVLKHVDYYIAECERDKRLAINMGLKGKFLGFFPAFGGFPITDYNINSQIKSSDRKRIFLKGRDHQDNGDPISRAGTALQAFELMIRDLYDYEIIIAQASPIIIKKSNYLIERGLNIKILKKVSYEEILSFLSTSRIFISLTINDGLPSSLIEAMALGAFPIHSNLEPIREWIINDENGCLVNPEDPEEVSSAILKALLDDNLVNAGQKLNYSLINDKLSEHYIQPRVIKMYENLI